MPSKTKCWSNRRCKNNRRSRS